MKLGTVTLLALVLGLISGAGDAQTITTLGSGFNQPGGVAIGADGTVFVADTANSAIEKISPTGSITPLGTGTGPLTGVAIDASGNIFALDYTAGRVVELPAATGYSTLNILASGIIFPIGIAVDGNSDVFVSVQSDGTVKEIAAAGGYATVKTIGSGISSPQGLATDSNGNVFVADNGDGTVKEILAAGGYTTVNVLATGLTFLNDIAVDGSGNVFVTAFFTPTIEEILADGGYSTVKMLPASFSHPEAVTIDAAGNLYIRDIMGLWKLPEAAGYATAAEINLPARNDVAGLAADAAGDLLLVSGTTSGIDKLSAANNYGSTTHIATPGFSAPAGIAIDGGGNLFVADTGNNAVKEMTVASGYAAITSVGSGFAGPKGVALDAQNDLVVADTGNGAVTELPAASGYASQKQLARAVDPNSVAVDQSGNVFFSDAAGLTEVTAAGTVRTLVEQANFFSGIAVDSSGNLFLSNNDPFVPTGYEIRERRAADGFATSTVAAIGFDAPGGIAVDGTGNIFVAETGNNAVREILATPPVLVASVLPGARSLAFGQTATVFATMINTAATALDNCQVALAPTAYANWTAISFNYQTTDSTTNAPTGEPNTPVTIPGGNGQQSFVLSLQADPSGPAFTAVNMPLQFTCGTSAVLQTAPVIPGVNMLSLGTSSTPVADVIALAATPANNGILTMPQDGAGAFAVASVNVGATESLTVAVDTGGVTLPLTATLCQTDPTSGQCLSPPTATLALTYAANAAPTFSVFVQSSGAIALAPATARIFVHFEDSSGSLHGVTSVAVDTQ